MVKNYFKVLLFMSLFIVLVGCNNNEDSFDDVYNEKTDYPYSFHTSDALIAPSDDGYYMLNGNFIYYMDTEGIPVLLDNRPDHECLQLNSDTNCNAYVSPFGSALLQFYKGSLYTLEYNSLDVSGVSHVMEGSEYQLVKRSPDGANREVIRTFPSAEVTQGAIHRDYLYYQISYYDENEDYNYELQRIPINNPKEEAEIVYKGRHESAWLNFIPYGLSIYITESTFFKEEMIRYDLINEEIYPFLNQEDDIDANILSFYKDKIYLNKYPSEIILDGEADNLQDDKWKTIYEVDRFGENETKSALQPVELINQLYKDDRYTYLRPNASYNEMIGRNIPKEIQILQDENLIHSVSLEGYTEFPEIVNGDERYMFLSFFFYEDEDEENYNKSYIYILDKNDIESGEATFNKLIENPHEIGDEFDPYGNPL